MIDDALILYRAAAVRDSLDTNARPGAVAARHRMIRAAGDETSVLREVGKPDRIIDLGDVLLMPGMVNAHAHLDLTHQPRVPYNGNFIDWLKGVIQSRVTEEHAITAAVHDGLRMSYESGVCGLADIAGSPAALRALLLSPHDYGLLGQGFLEVTGFGERGLEAAKAGGELLKHYRIEDDEIHLHRQGGASAFFTGLEPHAPYSTGREAYQYATTQLCCSTHLAETLEEAQFVRDATGPFADLLKRLGKWDDSIQPQGVSPVQYLRPHFEESKALDKPRWLVAHCNYVDDADIQTLADTQTSVAYCPVASDYFHHRNHRYRDMLEAGVNVCLGTDSIICQPEEEPQPLSILAQMRHLYRRDQTDPAQLLRMATNNGAVAIGERIVIGMLRPGRNDNFTAVRFDPHDETDPLIQVLLNHEPALSIGPSR